MQRKLGTYTHNGMTLEYSIVGEGNEPILVMHGGHSNCMEAFGYEALIEEGYSLITPSRAGYGNTSREIGKSLETAAQYYLNLLDYLGHEKTHLLCMSAGGPSGIYLAYKYPKRFKTITLQSAVSKVWHQKGDMLYKTAKILFHPKTERLTWRMIAVLNACAPHYLFQQMWSSFSLVPYQQIKSEIEKSDIEAFKKMNQRQRSYEGFMIDIDQTKDITLELLQCITTPTLIMHSEQDAAVPIEHAYHAHRHINSSELLVLNSPGHLIWIGKGSKEVTNKYVGFLEKHRIRK
ncbi:MULTISPECIES: alpha/beta hydrolase [unclassified Virgibacillus]|uniref:alpha/beta fold hydrolase n=1 Tax=unclassified Virgibacillus TaxID=2620237 RepID=UPI0024DE7878|nr:alpha/beta hydrolase [Virgibacillus sp. LDC-1]